MKPLESTKPAVTFSVLKLWRKAGRELRLKTDGTSMRPLIEPGDEITARLVDPDLLRLGDLMAFWNGNRVVIHRLIKRRQTEESQWFCEKADNLPGWNWIDGDRVLGKVVSIEGRKGRLKITRWPWKWVNPAVGFVLSAWVAFYERGRVLPPPVPGERPGFLNKILGGLLWVLNRTYRAAMSLFLFFVRLSGINRSAKA